MNRQEKELFGKLCNFIEGDVPADMLEYATPELLGWLLYNRMAGIAYHTLEKAGLLGKVNREFRGALTSVYEHNLMKNRSFYRGVKQLAKVLESCGKSYVMLKGALLCGYYPCGCRTASDVDILVLPEDVGAFGRALSEAGFKQGNIRGGVFVPASRAEIINSKLTRGETVPYVKQVDMPGLKYLEVDINFSLDHKNGNASIIEKMMKNSSVISVCGCNVSTLCKSDFFIHLCAHLYKEATVLPWVKMNRDMSLYKYCDIYMLLNDMDLDEIKKVFERAKELGMEKICAFAVLQTAQLFKVNGSAINAGNSVLRGDDELLHTVIDPGEGKTYVYKEKDVNKRFFSKNRKILLKEVK